MPCPGLRDRGAACQRVEAAVLGPGPCCRWEVVLARRPERGWGAGARGAARGAFPPAPAPLLRAPVGVDTTCRVHTKGHRHQSLRTRTLVLCHAHSEKVALGQLTSEQDRASNPEPRHRAIAGSAQCHR